MLNIFGGELKLSGLRNKKNLLSNAYQNVCLTLILTALLKREA